MNIFLWILQIFLALIFLLHGLLFVIWSPAMVARMQERRPEAKPVDLLPGFRIFIGAAEILAVIGLILPGFTNILPGLASLAAAGLLIVMAGAVVFHIRREEIPNAVMTGVLFLLTAFVAYMRWVSFPL